MNGKVWLASDPEIITQLTQGFDEVTKDVFGGLFITDRIDVARSIAYNNH